ELVGMPRQRERERGAAPVRRLVPEPAAVQLREALRDREPEPGAGLRWSVRERLEEPRGVGREAGPVVDDTQHHLVLGRLAAHLDAIAGRGGLERVLEQVRKDALDLIRVD